MNGISFSAPHPKKIFCKFFGESSNHERYVELSDDITNVTEPIDSQQKELSLVQEEASYMHFEGYSHGADSYLNQDDPSIDCGSLYYDLSTEGEVQENRPLLKSEELAFVQKLEPKVSKFNFYEKLTESPSTTKEYYDKLDDLTSLVDTVQTMKLLYTHLMIEFRIGNLPYWKDLKNYIKNGLVQTRKTIKCYQTYFIFQQILDKALEDQVIKTDDYQALINGINYSDQTEHSATEWSNTSEYNITRLNVPDKIGKIVYVCIDKIKGNIFSKQKILSPTQKNYHIELTKNLEKSIEAGVGIMGVILNALIFYQGDTRYDPDESSIVNRIVDFGDIKHMLNLASDTNAQDSALLPLSIKAIDRLELAIEERNPLKIFKCVASIIESIESKYYKKKILHHENSSHQIYEVSISSCAEEQERRNNRISSF